MNSSFYKAVASLLLVSFLASCGKEQEPIVEKKPVESCDSQKIQDAALQIIAKKFLEDGLKGYSSAEIKQLLSITDIKAKEKIDSYYKCKASLTVAFSPDLGEKIATAYSSIQARAALKDRLEKKLGLLEGPPVFNKINESIANGPYGVVPLYPIAKDLDDLSDTIKKNSDILVNEDNRIAFTYEIKPENLADGCESTSVTTYVDDFETFDLDHALLSLNGVL